MVAPSEGRGNVERSAGSDAGRCGTLTDQDRAEKPLQGLRGEIVIVREYLEAPGGTG